MVCANLNVHWFTPMNISNADLYKIDLKLTCYNY